MSDTTPGVRRLSANANALELALRALTSRERSRRDVDERLARASVPEPERSETLETLERLGYVDDARFAATRAAALAGRGYGDEAIRHDLARHGITRAGADVALADLPAEPERAATVLAGPGRRERIAVRLARKGFSPESISAALGGFAEGGDAA